MIAWIGFPQSKIASGGQMNAIKYRISESWP